MKRFAVVVAVLVGVAGTAAPAIATRERPASTVRHLREQIRALRAQVHSLTAERDALKAALARSTTRLPKAHTPTPLALAVRQVRHEVQWAQGSTTEPLSGQLAAEAAMDYVVGHVSTGAYGYLELVFDEAPGGPKLPSYYESVNTILASQTGICVHAERTFAAIVTALGFQVRDVGFDYVELNGEPGSHSAAEVFYDGGWHFFDPTFGRFWTDAAGNVLSITDVRAAGGIEHRDNASFTNVIEDVAAPAGGDTWFETDPRTTLVFVAPHKR